MSQFLLETTRIKTDKTKRIKLKNQFLFLFQVSFCEISCQVGISAGKKRQEELKEEEEEEEKKVPSANARKLTNATRTYSTDRENLAWRLLIIYSSDVAPQRASTRSRPIA